MNEFHGDKRDLRRSRQAANRIPDDAPIAARIRRVEVECPSVVKLPTVAVASWLGKPLPLNSKSKSAVWPRTELVSTLTRLSIAPRVARTPNAISKHNPQNARGLDGTHDASLQPSYTC